MFYIVLLVGLALAVAGCNYEYMSTTGPSLCPTDHALDEAADMAVAYWNAAGAHLDSICTAGAIAVEVGNVPDSIEGKTVINLNGMPTIRVHERVLAWAQGNPKERASAAGTLAHELGHAIGLDHVSDRSSIMYPSTSWLPAVPSQIDIHLMRNLLAKHASR